MTSFTRFPDFLQLDLLVSKDIEVKTAYTGSAKALCGKFTCIEDASVEDISDRGAFIGNTSTTKASANKSAVKDVEIDL